MTGTLWKKLGKLYTLPENGLHPKLLTHAANPLAVHLEKDIFRIFFSSRDAQKRSSVGAVDIDIISRKIIHEHHRPIVEHGLPNSFYADGISIGCCYSTANTSYMTFMAWQNPPQGHWRGDIGRFTLASDLTLHSPELLMGSDATDPLSLSYPWIIQNEQRDFTMWYGSTVTWDAGNGEMLHVIKRATSRDGHQWQREGISIPYVQNSAQAFSRPTILRSPIGGYEMWFSYRGMPDKPYRIGYATSDDGQTWSLALDKAGIDVSKDGWDSHMIEYPFVFEHKADHYMLYNGNGFGKTGFGLAIRE